MTAETSCVGVEANWNRAGDTATGRAMAGRTTHFAHVHVARMIKIHSEAFQGGERLHCAGTHVGMANRADGTFTVRELLRVTANARYMSRSTREVWPR
jgi:hypothetical protein